MNKLILFKIILLMVLNNSLKALDLSNLRKDFEGTVNSIGDFLDVAKDAAFNCSATPEDLKLEIAFFFGEILAVTSQEVLKDVIGSTEFPTACHVLYPEVLNDISIEKNLHYKEKEKVLDLKLLEVNHSKFGFDMSYYWPKYFIEVSEKSNDPYKAFSNKNAMYRANRKLVEQISSQYDTAGFQGILDKIKGSAVSGLSSLIPLGNSGMRASKDPDQSSFEVNVWPVALSHALGKLSVCGALPRDENKVESIGYNFQGLTKLAGDVGKVALAGVPNLCPLSTSQDLGPYWYTGFLDFTDPNPLKKAALTEVLEPMKCLTASAVNMIGNQGYHKSDFFDQNAGQDFKNYLAKVKDLANTSFAGLLGCSFPLTGSAEALMKNYIAASKSFEGPYCSLWGPLFPRMSVHFYNNDYSFALAALKYKLLAEEIHGLPRVNKERWSLAYPWDGSGSGVIDDKFKDAKKLVGKVGEYFGKGFDMSSRSENLYIPGDVRLIDLVLNPTHMANRTTQLTKEVSYVLALTAAGEAAKKAVKESEKLKKENMNNVNQAEEETRVLGDEDIVKCEKLCHRSQVNGTKILLGSASNKIYVGDRFEEHYKDDKPEKDSYSFSNFSGSKDECLKEDGYNDKIGEHGVNHSTAIFYERCTVIGTRKSKNPSKATIIKTTPYRHIETRKGWDCGAFTCDRKRDNDLLKVHLKDTVSFTKIENREFVRRPEREETDDRSELKASLAKAAVWVGSELVRQKYEKITGTNQFPGNKRVYTVWQKVECTTDYKIRRYELENIGKIGVDTYITDSGISPCRAFLRRKLRDLFHKKFMRRYCDLLTELGSPQSLGAPFK